MNDQEAFETVARHLFTQGKQSVNSIGVCTYRGSEDTKCAVGCLIPDSEYKHHMDLFTYTVSALVEDFSVPSLEGINILMLRYLQSLHDLGTVYLTNDYLCYTIVNKVWDSTKDMREGLRAIGAHFGLNTEFLSELSFKDR